MYITNVFDLGYITMNEITSGVTYNNSVFTFNFENDDETDIIQLRKNIKTIDFIGSVLKYSYEFDKNTSSTLRTKFIHDIKFDSNIPEDDIEKFVRIAVSKLCNDINIDDIGCIVFPESRSKLVDILLKHLKLASNSKITTIKLIKELPKNIEFDTEEFEEAWLDSSINGKPRYTDKQKKDTLEKVKKYMDLVHKLDYFSIARNFKKKYRMYIKNFYKFASDRDKNLFKSISRKPVLLVDDIATTGTTMAMLLKSLRILGCSNITMFSLIGNEKLK